jgi:hypothetical protein
LGVALLSVPSGHAEIPGEYHSNNSLSAYIATRVDSNLDFNWGSPSYSNMNTPDDNFTVRWRGLIYIPTSNAGWRFRSTADDGRRLYIDGNLIFDAFTATAQTSTSGNINLSAGWHPIVFDFREIGGGASTNLQWNINSLGSDTSYTVVPAANLAAGAAWDWNTNLTMGWGQAGMTSIAATGGTLAATYSTNTDPILLAPSGNFGDPFIRPGMQRYLKLVVRLNWVGANESFQLFFARRGEGFDEAKSIRFNVAATNSFNTYYIDMAQVGEWRSTLNSHNQVTAFRLDPGDNVGGANNGRQVIIDEMAFVGSARELTSTRTSGSVINTATSSVNYAVRFSEPVTGIDPTDFTLTNTGGVTAQVNSVNAVFDQTYTFGSAPAGWTAVGTAGVTGGYLRLTDAVNGQQGAYTSNAGTLPAMKSFRASFTARINAGSGNPADGYSFEYGTLSGASFAEFGEAGTTGLKVCFITYNGASGGRHFEIRYPDDTVRYSFPIQNRNDGNRADFVPIEVTVREDGRLDVMRDNVYLVQGLNLSVWGAWNPTSAWRMGLGARTGGENQNHHFDDLRVISSDYTVNVGNFGGGTDGTLRLDLAGSNNITDFKAYPLVPNTFTTGEVYTVDRSRPSATLSTVTSSPTNGAITVNVVTGESTSNLISGDITPSNASVSGFTGSGTNYSFTLTPTAAGSFSAVINANAFTDANANGNTASNTLSLTFDNTQPNATLSSAAGNPVNGAISVTVVTTEATTTLEAGDINTGNASVSGFSGSGSNYSFTLTPTAPGPFSASILPGVFTDAAGNGNTASNAFSRVFDNTPPGATLTSAAGDPVYGSITVNVVTTESTVNLVSGDITPTNASVSGFSGSGTAYSFTLTPTTGGVFSAVINAGAFTDTAGNGNTLSNVLSRTFDDSLTILTDPAGGTYYSGEPVTLSITHTGGVGPYNYQWIDADSNLHPGSPDAATWNIPAVLLSQAGSYRCLVTDSTLPSSQFDISAEAILTVVPSVEVTTQPVGGHGNTGGSFTFTVAATGGVGAYTYDWYKTGNGTPLQSGPSASFNIPSLALGDAGSYYCVVSDTGTSSDTSDTVALQVTDLLAVALTPGTPTGIDGLQASSTGLTDVYTGGSLTLSVTPAGGAAPYTYAWAIDYGTGFVPAQGVINQPTYTVASAGPLYRGIYRCTVNDNSPDPAVTATIAVGVYNPLQLSQAPQNQTVNVTDTATFTVLELGGIPPLTYTWRKGGVPLGAPSQNTLAYGPTVYPADNGATFDVVIDDAVPGGAVTSSPVATLTVTNNIGVNLGGDSAAYVGDTVVLTPAVGGGNGVFTYVWTKDGLPLNNGGNVTGAGTGSVTITGATAANAGTYGVTVSDSSGVNAPDTDTAALSVTPHVSITASPTSLNRYVGTPASFTVTVTGGIAPVSFDWRESGASLGAPDQNSYVIPAVALADNGKIYDVVVTEGPSDYSAGVPQTSGIAALNVANPLTVTGPVPASVQAYTTDAPFDLEVTASGGFGTPTYQWVVNVPLVGPVPVPGYTLNPQSFDPASAAALLGTGTFSVFCVVTDAGGSVPSGTTTVELADVLVITDGLEDTTAPQGLDFTWDITVDGGLSPVTFQWSRELDGGSKVFELIPGANSNTLLIEDLAYEDAGTYLVEVTDGGTGNASSQASLSVVQGVPAAGLLGLSLLTLSSALGGAVLLRRKKK